MSLYLGLPQWSHPAWPGQLLGMNARPAEHLADYARVFNPWRATPPSTPTDPGRRCSAGLMWSPTTFASASSFPRRSATRAIERGQTGDGLHPPAGPCMTSWGCSSCNCPPASGQRGWPVWMPSSRGCPRISPMPSRCATPIFRQGEAERPSTDADGAGITASCLDSRPLFSVPATTAAMIDAQGKKPRLPVHLHGHRGCPGGAPDWFASNRGQSPILPPWLPIGNNGSRRARISTSLSTPLTMPGPGTRTADQLPARPGDGPWPGETIAPARGAAL